MNQAERLQDERRLGIRRTRVLLLAVIVLSFGACQNRCARDTASPPLVHTGPAPSAYADVVSRVTPAVVTIRSERRVRAPRQHPFFDAPFFREFLGERFGGALPQPRASSVDWGRAC